METRLSSCEDRVHILSDEKGLDQAHSTNYLPVCFKTNYEVIILNGNEVLEKYSSIKTGVFGKRGGGGRTINDFKLSVTQTTDIVYRLT